LTLSASSASFNLPSFHALIDFWLLADQLSRKFESGRLSDLRVEELKVRF
jgi:hypothetical protein